jgi:outer membrane protein assembly factor BamB
MNAESTTSVPHAPERAAPPAPAKAVRLWPALVLLALYWVAHFIVDPLQKPYFVGFLFNLGSAALLALLCLVWWWTNRRISLRDRLYGSLLIIFGGLIVEPFCHESIGWWGLLMTGLPVVLTAWALWTIMTRKFPPSWRRLGSVFVVALAWGFFTLVRIDGFDSSLRADLHWRWHPSAEELFLATRTHTAKSAPDSQPSHRAGEVISLRPGDWPAFRGPDREGVIRGVAIATDWDTAPPQLLWRQRIGPAWSSLIVVDGRLYTQEQRGERESVVCYEAQTGRELWAHEDAVRFWESVSGAGPRATPTFTDGRIYCLGGTGILNCLDAGTGERRWSRDIAAEAGARPPQWGYSGSPLVVDGLVIAFAGGDGEKNLLAYRAETGDPVWSAPAGKASYSSPQLVMLAGRRQCLMLSDRGLTAVDPTTGVVLWKSGASMPGAPRTIQPHIVSAAQLLVGTFDGPGVSLIDVNRDGDAWNVVPRWTSKDLKPEFPDLVVHNGHAYGFDIGIFCCIDLSTGKRCWKEGRYGRGQVVLLADEGLLLVMSETGEAVLLAANPEQHEELGRFRALDGKTWNHPLIAHGRLYVRNAEEIACYELKPAPTR